MDRALPLKITCSQPIFLFCMLEFTSRKVSCLFLYPIVFHTVLFKKNIFGSECINFIDIEPYWEIWLGSDQFSSGPESWYKLSLWTKILQINTFMDTLIVLFALLFYIVLWYTWVCRNVLILISIPFDMYLVGITKWYDKLSFYFWNYCHVFHSRYINVQYCLQYINVFLPHYHLY